jgi:hypothetical protein
MRLPGGNAAVGSSATWKASPLSTVGVSPIICQPSRPQCTTAGSGRAMASPAPAGIASIGASGHQNA